MFWHLLTAFFAGFALRDGILWIARGSVQRNVERDPDYPCPTCTRRGPIDGR